MALNRYQVSPNGTKWKIIHEGKEYHYDTQSAAIRAAVDAAKSSGDKGHENSQVLVQGNNGQFRTEWTYGKDSYPPKG